MKRDLVMSAAIAAVVHAGLLFGVRPTRAEPVSPTRAGDVPVIPICPIPVDSPSPAESSADAEPGRPAADARPIMDPPPVTASPRGFAIDQPTTLMPRPVLGPVPPLAPLADGPPGGKAGGFGREPFRIGDLDSTPKTRSMTRPPYPFEARRAGLSGEVLVEFEVDESGAVQAPHAVRSSDRVFEAPALYAVARWRFEPGLRGGKPVRFRMAVPIVFSLGNE